jgi:hypothetical protein
MGGFKRAPVTKCKSRIDGKLIRVRHATEADVIFIQKMMESYGLYPSVLDYDNYVIADQEGELLGFGIAGKGDPDRERFSVYVDKRYGYLAEMIVKHLVENPRRQ